MSKLKISIISQEKKLKEIEAESLTAPTTTGQVTILPEHLPLFSTLSNGELIYRNNNQSELFAVTGGFLDVRPNSEVIVIVDTIKAAREISLADAREAIKAAKEKLHQKQELSMSQEELLKVEASLKQALLEEKIALKSSKATI